MADVAKGRQCAEHALHGYVTAKSEVFDYDGSVIDLITDLLHWSKQQGYDVDHILSCAQLNYQAETP